jgi:hypothetical protein
MAAMTEEVDQGDEGLLRAHLRTHDDPCPKCRYNLRGVIAPVCPECGSPLQLRAGLNVPARKYSVRAGGTVASVGLAILALAAASPAIKWGSRNPVGAFIGGVLALLAARWFWVWRSAWIQERARWQQVGLLAATGGLVALVLVWFIGSLH